MKFKRIIKLALACLVFTTPVWFVNLTDQEYYEHSYEIMISFEEVFGNQVYGFFEGLFELVDDLNLSNEVKAYVKNLMITLSFTIFGFVISLLTGYLLVTLSGKAINRIIKRALTKVEDEPSILIPEPAEGYFYDLRRRILQLALDTSGQQIQVTRLMEDDALADYLNITLQDFVDLINKVESFFLSRGFKTSHATILAVCVVAFAETEPLKYSNNAVYRFCVSNEDPIIYFEKPEIQNFIYV